MKKILSILLAAVMVLSFAACGNAADPAPAEDAAPAEETAAPETTEPGETEEYGEDTGDGYPPLFETVSAEKKKEIWDIYSKYIIIEEDELKYEFNTATKTLVISGEGPMREYIQTVPEWAIYSDMAEKVVIGDKITAVGAGAFWGFSVLKEVEFADTVEYIGEDAFDNCQMLWTINFPANLKYVGAYAFNNTLLHSDSGFIFPEGLLYIGNCSFSSAFKESYVSIPSTMVGMGIDALSNCFLEKFVVAAGNPEFEADDDILYSKGKKVLMYYPAQKTDTVYEIPEGVGVIGPNAIEVTADLQKIFIPASVYQISEQSIFWNYGLTEIDTDENNEEFKSIDGVLFSKDGKGMVAYPTASERTEYTVPEGTERICNYAMSQVFALKKLHVPEGVREFGDLALWGNSALEYMSLPESLETVGDSTFGFCDNLREIDYAGSRESFESIAFGPDNDQITQGMAKIYLAK